MIHFWLMLLLTSWTVSTTVIVAVAAHRYCAWRRAMRRTLSEIRRLPERATH